MNPILRTDTPLYRCQSILWLYPNLKAMGQDQKILWIVSNLLAHGWNTLVAKT